MKTHFVSRRRTKKKKKKVNSFPPSMPGCIPAHCRHSLPPSDLPGFHRLGPLSVKAHTHTHKHTPYERDDKLCPLPCVSPPHVSCPCASDAGFPGDQTAGSCMSPHCRTIVGLTHAFRVGVKGSRVCRVGGESCLMRVQKAH